MTKVLVIGANGQLGSELTAELRRLHGQDRVIASDIRELPDNTDEYSMLLDATDSQALFETIKNEEITEVYHLAAILSAKGESDPLFAWDLNMKSLLNVLELAREGHLKKIYWPSSIAVFGPDTPKVHTPQRTIMNPNTVYGISKLAGEKWCEYYHQKYGVDVRSLRYPGLIGYKAQPGGGTTDYAVDIFFKAANKEHFKCFLGAHSMLPMMYMDDAIRATIELMTANPEVILVRNSYNLSAMSFTPSDIYREVAKYAPDFTISYEPDFRQAIADSWPQIVDDAPARKDWGWQEKFNLEAMVKEIMSQLTK
ncbi:MAG: NAD-dependent epimerase/dehydratase family protein [Cyclobacteriaceae bacterium]